MTPEQTEILAIIHTLNPQWGRTTRPCICGGSGWHSEWVKCPDCKGRGYQFREWFPCPKNGKGCDGREYDLGGTVCDGCDGEGRIPDTEGLAAISEAVVAWTLDGCHFAPSSEWFSDFKNCRDDYDNDAPLQQWNNRHNQPWCESLEAHVAAYQQQPPEGDELLRLVKGLLDANGYDWGILSTLGLHGRYYSADVTDLSVKSTDYIDADTELAALLSACRAASKIGGE